MNPPLRVALLVDPLTLSVKGGDHAPQLARELLGRGHIVRGFGAAPGAIPRSSPDAELAVGDESVGAEYGPHTASVGAVERDAPGPLAFQPDVLVAYDALSPAAWLGARTARRLNAPLVLVEVGADVAQSRLHERVLQNIGRRLWGGYVRNTAQAIVALDPVAERRAVSEGFPQGAVTLVPRGVDLQEFRPGLTSGLVALHRVRGRILTYIGRLEPDRGVSTLLTAFARTVGQRHDWTLILAGEGSEEQSLRASAMRAGVADRVRWLRRPRPEEVPGLLGASTLVAVPAESDAVLGKQVLRAMSAGVPILCSDLPRLSWLVEDDVTGLTVPAGDVASWTEALSRAAGDPQARRRWGAHARQFAEERLAWPCIGARFETILGEARETLASRPRPNSPTESPADPPDDEHSDEQRLRA